MARDQLLLVIDLKQGIARMELQLLTHYTGAAPSNGAAL